MHVFSTYSTMSHNFNEIYQKNKAKMLIGGLAVSCFVVFLIYWDLKLFYIVQYYAVVFHIIKQQEAWFFISRTKVDFNPSRRIWEKIVLWNMMLPISIYWLSAATSDRKWFFSEAFPHIFSIEIGYTAIALHWIINIAFLTDLLIGRKKGRKINLGALSILISTWMCYYIPYVIFESFLFGLVMIQLIHSVPYIYLNLKESKKKFYKHAGLISLVGVLLISLGILQLSSTTYYSETVGNIVHAIIWIPAFLHYYFDTFLWKRNEST